MSTVELAVLAPALMMLCMLIVQFGLWFNARQAALAAAQAGAQVARQEAAIDPGWRPAAQTAATKYYKELNTKLLGKLTATVCRGAGGLAVSRHAAAASAVSPSLPSRESCSPRCAQSS